MPETFQKFLLFRIVFYAYENIIAVSLKVNSDAFWNKTLSLNWKYSVNISPPMYRMFLYYLMNCQMFSKINLKNLWLMKIDCFLIKKHLVWIECN